MLHDLQRRFAAVALHKTFDPLLPLIQAERGSKERRLGVYHANTLNSLIDVLESAYPVTKRIVGERFFKALAKSYIEIHPPQQPTLFRYGGTLGDFLDGFAPAKDLPYLADTARLEWIRIEAYFAEDREPIDPQQLAEVSPEQIGDVRFTPHPAFQCIQSKHPIFQIWAINQPDHQEVPEVDFSVPEAGFVSRQDLMVFQRVETQGTFAWLNALVQGRSLGAATEEATGQDPNFDLQNALRQHLADGTFTDVHRPSPMTAAASAAPMTQEQPNECIS